MADSNIEPTLFKNVSYRDIVLYMNDFLTQTERNFNLYQIKPDIQKLEKARRDLISFMAINSQLISRFGLFENILSKFVLLFK